MTLTELKSILNALEPNQPQGVGLISLAAQTGISAQTLRAYLMEHQDYFVQLPGAKTYGINRFGKFKGSVIQMLTDYEKQLESHRTRTKVFYPSVFAALFVLMMVIMFGST